MQIDRYMKIERHLYFNHRQNNYLHNETFIKPSKYVKEKRNSFTKKVHSSLYSHYFHLLICSTPVELEKCGNFFRFHYRRPCRPNQSHDMTIITGYQVIPIQEYSIAEREEEWVCFFQVFRNAREKPVKRFKLMDCLSLTNLC